MAASGSDAEMPCYYPRNAYRGSNGVVSLREPPAETAEGFEVLGIPCGYCIGCRVRQARDWALRCHLEAAEHEESCWVTLTYDDSHLPPSGFLVKDHLSGFLKRLRARVYPDRVRFFGCGEYGEQTRRPHYHAILFGLRNSPQIQASWPFGFAREDPLTPEAISYVAGYVGKKIGDPNFRPRTEIHDVVDYSTGEILGQRFERIKDPHAPFRLMSRRPGIGGDARRHWRSWSESAVWRGDPVPVPRFLHEAYKLRASDEEYAALQERKRSQLVERGMRDKRYKADILRAGEANALSLLAIKSDSRKL